LDELTIYIWKNIKIIPNNISALPTKSPYLLNGRLIIILEMMHIVKRVIMKRLLRGELFPKLTEIIRIILLKTMRK
jgi:hypothetical protein